VSATMHPLRSHRPPHVRRAGRSTVLVTGFGPFPGVPVNATMRLLPELVRVATSRFPDVRLVAEILPTEWAAAPRRLDRLLADVDPDLALHFGVSSRARGFEIERRAQNACSVQPDAAGVLPVAPALSNDGAEHLAVSLPVQHVVARLRRRGIPAFASRDAGAYLCNATLYHSLVRGRDAPGRRIGFVHIPASLARPGGANRGRTGACPLTWVQVVDGALEILAACLGRQPGRMDRAGRRPAMQDRSDMLGHR
jgi:pyroglutamyl-peptidase